MAELTPSTQSWFREVQVVSSTSLTVERRPPSRSRHGFLKTAVLIFLVVTVIHPLINRLPFGETIRDFEHATLRRALMTAFAVTSPLQGDDPLSPAVVDISDIPFDRLKPTDRKMLGRLVRDLQGLGAAAIGIDIDFSPENERQVSRDDQQLFLEWGRSGNVRAGVFRRAGSQPDEWLGSWLFRDVAAGIMLPADDPMFAFAYSSSLGLPEGRRTEARLDSPPAYLLQLPAALYEVRHHDERPWLDRDRVREEGEVGGRIRLGRFPVDYSYLKGVRRILYHKNDSLKPYEEWIAGKTILIGDTRDTQDSRSIPGEKEPVPGVMIHAAAFATLNHGLLRYPGEWTGIFFEVLALAVALAMIYFISSRKIYRQLTDEALEIRCFSYTAIALFILGTSLVGLTRLFWPDFVWASVFLFVHPYLAMIWRRAPITTHPYVETDA